MTKVQNSDLFKDSIVALGLKPGCPSPTNARGTGEPIFTPDPIAISRSQLTAFTGYCEQETGIPFLGEAAFHEFSVTNYQAFWRLFLRWSHIPFDGEIHPVCTGDSCETAQFFPNLRINYADILLRDDDDPDRIAITACHFGGKRDWLTRRALRARVARLAAFLRKSGVRPGTRVVAIARNNAEAAIAALATASLGAAFSSCGPEMGPFAILSRFAPLQPLVLMAGFKTEPWDGGARVAERIVEVARQLSSLTAIIALDEECAPEGFAIPVHRLTDIVACDSASHVGAWPRFPFNLPLFIMFSSGTTGAPKCIVHGAGGTLLEHVKEHRLHCDLRYGDKLFFHTSCSWMMWNWQLTALASGTELVLFDGPVEGPHTLWQLVAKERVTVFGTSPAYLQLCERTKFAPRRAFDLSTVRSVLSTGSILYPRQYDWVRDHVKELPLQSISGGTDIIGCFVLGNPNLPVRRGEAQWRSLGLDVRSLPPSGEPNPSIGELVCVNPFPSRPLGFHGDADGARFHAAYFTQNPGVWTHGDLIEFTAAGGARLHGRSDGVLNVHGIRVGPAEIYRVLQDIEDVVEAMAVEQRAQDGSGDSRLVLLVLLRPGVTLNDALTARIRSELARRGSLALVPERIAQVDALPMTHNGKRSEAAACDVLNGRAARNSHALQNPECLEAIALHPALCPGNSTAVAQRENSPVSSSEYLESELQRICGRVMGVASIGKTVNLLELGADSLTIINSLMEIEEQLHCRIPFPALLHSPTIEKLAAFIRENASSADNDDCRLSALDRSVTATTTGPRIRAAGPGDIESICRLLDRGFGNPTLRVDTWRRLFDYPWLEDKPNLGFVLVDGNLIVGFIGAIYSRRCINGRTALVCNLSSWYVGPEYRGWGVPLFAAAVEDETLTYTALTPVPVTQRILVATGFQSLNSKKLFFPPFLHMHTFRGHAPTITLDPAKVVDLLNEEQRQIFDDHRPCDCLHAVVSHGPESCYLVAKRRVRPRTWLHRLAPMAPKVAHSELLYCSAPHLLTRHLEPIKRALMRKQRTAGLIADDRLFPNPRPRGIAIDDQGFYRSPLIPANKMNKLYSELVLLPI